MTNPSMVSLIAKDDPIAERLSLAANLSAGSHVYTVDAGGNRLTDAWTIFGVVYTKTYTYVSTSAGAGMLTESNWVSS